MAKEAGQAEILRAVQRDDVFKKRLHDATSQLVSTTLGPLQWVKWRHLIEMGSTFAYQALTTLGNIQTLGEEYTGIIHWTAQQELPSKNVQFVMVLLNCFGERITLNLINRLEKYLTNLPVDHEMRPEAREILLSGCIYMKRIVPILLLLHQVVFYFQGRYFDVAKRVTGTRYRLVRFWLGDQSSLSTFHLLGAISLLHLCVKVFTTIREISSQPPAAARRDVSVLSGAKCSLCLNLREHTSTTPCGHLFCWECILNWVQEQPLCPLCRQEVPPSRVVYLRNYT